MFLDKKIVMFALVQKCIAFNLSYDQKERVAE